jgi:hypothetical protein
MRRFAGTPLRIIPYWRRWRHNRLGKPVPGRSAGKNAAQNFFLRIFVLSVETDCSLK